jgi:hypothetical protein
MTKGFFVCVGWLLLWPGIAAAQAPLLNGRWSGYWISDFNGHNGPLHANVRQKDSDTYRVTFSGRFAKVIPFRYTATMQVIGRGEDVLILAAERRLGFRGTFRTTAVVTHTHFDATFTSPRDYGRFVLTRR